MARHPAPARLVGLMLMGLVLAVIASLLFGQGMDGWHWPSWLRWQAQLEWRLPRTLAAGAAGMLLALAGTLLQRVSSNPMASPELLGVSGGTFMGVIATALLLPALPLPMMLAGGLLGAFGCLLLLLLVNRSHGFQPERLLLSGIAITALFEPLQAIALANGDLRVQQLLSWMSGSTYYVTLPIAGGLVVLALTLLAACLLLSRWLDLLPMGPAVAAALGIRLNRAQLAILLLVAVLTASATLVVGPLSFVGLLAPHMAKLMGLVRARWHLLGAAVFGALLMVSADWIGQQILFPQEVPVGLVSTLLGALTSCGAYAACRLVDENAQKARMNPGFSLPAVQAYLPMQKLEKMRPSRSSELNSPVISERTPAPGAALRPPARRPRTPPAAPWPPAAVRRRAPAHPGGGGGP